MRSFCALEGASRYVGMKAPNPRCTRAALSRPLRSRPFTPIELAPETVTNEPRRIVEVTALSCKEHITDGRNYEHDEVLAIMHDALLARGGPVRRRVADQ